MSVFVYSEKVVIDVRTIDPTCGMISQRLCLSQFVGPVRLSGIAHLLHSVYK